MSKKKSSQKKSVQNTAQSAATTDKQKIFSPDFAFKVLLLIVALLPLSVGNIFGITFVAEPLTSIRLFALTTGIATVGIIWTVCLYRNQIPARLHLTFWLLALWAFLSFASSFSANSPFGAFFGDFDNIFGFLTYLGLIALFIMTVQLVSDQKKLISLSSAIIFSGVGVALIAWIQRLSGFDPLTGMSLSTSNGLSYYLTRGTGTLGNPDFLGHALLLPAILALAFFALSFEKKDKIIYGASFFIISGAIVGSATRGALIALLIAGIFFLAFGAWKRYPVKLPALLFALSLVLAFIIAIPISLQANDSIVERFFGAPSTQASEQISEDDHRSSTSLGGRLPLWREVFEIVKADPLLGIGPANTMHGWRLYRSAESLSIGSGATMTDAHNLILELLATVGIPATLAATLFLFAVLYLAVKTNIESPKAEEDQAPRGRITHLAWTAGLVAFMVSMLTSMTTLTWMTLFFVNLAILISPHTKKIDLRYPLQRERGFIRIASVVGVIASIIFASYGTLVMLSNTVQATASKAKDPLARLDTAAKITPFNLSQGDYVAKQHQQLALNTNADLQLRLSSINKAIEIYKSILQKSPQSYDPYYGLALSYYIKAEFTGDAADIARGHEYSAKGLKLYPAALDLRTAAATAYNSMGRYEEAYDMLKGWVGYDLKNQRAEDSFKIAADNIKK